MQTRRQSLTEAGANIFIGYWINIVVQLIVYPWYGAVFTFEQNIHIGLIFLVTGFIRSYAFRRYFNWRHRHAKVVQS